MGEHAEWCPTALCPCANTPKPAEDEPAERWWVGFGGSAPGASTPFCVGLPWQRRCSDFAAHYGGTSPFASARDILGGDSAIFGYEVDGLGYDGLDYVISGGLPRPAQPELYPDSCEILALGLASTPEEGPTILPGEGFLATEDAEYVAGVLTGGPDAAGSNVPSARRGRSSISARVGVRCSTPGPATGLPGWRSDPMVEQVTRTVLRRFLSVRADRCFVR